MKMPSDANEQPARGGSIRSWAGFFIALGLSILVLRLWGDHIVVRAILGSCWGGYAFFSLGGPDLIRWMKEARSKKQSRTE
jgi:hypothetical protein